MEFPNSHVSPSSRQISRHSAGLPINGIIELFGGGTTNFLHLLYTPMTFRLSHAARVVTDARLRRSRDNTMIKSSALPSKQVLAGTDLAAC